MLFFSEFSKIWIFILLSSFLAAIIFTASLWFSTNNPDSEKLSVYECGFDPYEDARHSFDVRFYLVAILFIIFDIEAMFLFPWSVSLHNLDTLGFWTMVDFIVELGVGFVYAWKIGALEWE